MLEDGHGSQGHGAQNDTCLGQLAAVSIFISSSLAERGAAPAERGAGAARRPPPEGSLVYPNPQNSSD